MKKYFLSGLVILLPLVITYWVIKLVLNTITGPFEQIVTGSLAHYNLFQTGFWIFSQAEMITIITKVLILISLVLLLAIVGFTVRWAFFKTFFYLIEKVCIATPFLNKIYGASKDFTEAIFSPKSKSFSQVVLVPYPSPAHKAIGLVTGEFHNQVIDNNEEVIYAVLIPGTPNPLMGFILYYTPKQITFLDITAEEALKFVISCGSSVPDSFLIEKPHTIDVAP